MKINLFSLVFHGTALLLTIGGIAAAWHFASWFLGAGQREASSFWIFEQVGVMCFFLLGLSIALNLLTSIPRMRQKKSFWALRDKNWPR